MVPLVNFVTYREFAIIRMDYSVPANAKNPAVEIKGNGYYTLIEGFAGPIQAMDLRLSLDEQPLVAFDQELENIEHIFPAINIVVDMNDQMCDDAVLTMRARRLLPDAVFGN